MKEKFYYRTLSLAPLWEPWTKEKKQWNVWLVSRSVCLIISRPGQSQGQLYKHLRNSLIQLVILESPTALRRRHAQTVRASTSSYKIDCVIVIKNFLNPEGHQNPISGSKVTAISLKGWILPIGRVALGRVWACSLHSRLVLQSGEARCWRVCCQWGYPV